MPSMDYAKGSRQFSVVAALLSILIVPAVPSAHAAPPTCATGWTMVNSTARLSAACQRTWSGEEHAGVVVVPPGLADGVLTVSAVGGASAAVLPGDAVVGELTGRLLVQAGDTVSVSVGATPAAPDTTLTHARGASELTRAVAAGAGPTPRDNVVPEGFTAGFQRADSAAVASVVLSYTLKGVGPKIGLRTFVLDGPTPFISLVFVDGVDLASVTKASFTVSPSSNASVPALTGTYTRAALSARGYLDMTLGRLVVPVYGLYEGRVNQVRVGVSVGSVTTTAALTVKTRAWADIASLTLASKEVFVARRQSIRLGFDYFYLKYYASPNGPVVFDVDGEPRWVGIGSDQAQSVAFAGDSFFLAGKGSPTLTRLGLDGRRNTVANYAALGVTSFHHNVDPGKAGLLLESDIPGRVRSTLMDVRRDGSVAGSWDVATALTAAMRAGGDDPSILVRPSQNWCHMNAAAYWPAQDQVVVSCREQFVVGMDYLTGQLRWILGDPTKSWYQYPSLRALALAVNGNPPIGQHAVSFPTKNEILLFDNGVPSNNAGVGQPTGSARSYSAPRRYRLDLRKRTATETWTYSRTPSIFCRVTGSVYQVAGTSLVNYAAELEQQYVRLVGLGTDGSVAFEYRWRGPQTLGWNAVPMNLGKITWLGD